MDAETFPKQVLSRSRDTGGRPYQRRLNTGAEHQSADQNRGRSPRGATPDLSRKTRYSHCCGPAHAGLPAVDSWRAWADRTHRGPCGAKVHSGRKAIALAPRRCGHVRVPLPSARGCQLAGSHPGLPFAGQHRKLFREPRGDRAVGRTQLEFGGALSARQQDRRVDLLREPPPPDRLEIRYRARSGQGIGR